MVGSRARAQYLLEPGNTAIEVKRKTGTGETVKIGKTQYEPVELQARLLSYVRSYASEYLGENVERAVISVPAYFDNRQRLETVMAGHQAGFFVERIINEPTAAAMCYGLNPFYGLLRKEKEDNSFTLERVRLLEKAADYKEVLYNHVLWDDPRNLSEYWAYLVASICCDTDEKANDSKLRRFSQLDIQLCMLRERDRILSEMDIIRKDYPFVYDRHREFLDQLQSDDPEKMKKKLEWEFNKQSGSYAGSFYRELLGIPEKHETMRPAFPDFPDLPFAPDEDNGSAPLFPEPDAPFVREKQKIGRNDPCPCGSGKKFKNCCLGKGIYD